MADFSKAFEFVKSQQQEYEDNVRNPGDKFVMVGCSECFSDVGLRIVCESVGFSIDAPCPRCGATGGAKLDRKAVRHAMERFFGLGTLHRFDFGGAPLLVANSKQKNDVVLAEWSGEDLNTLHALSGWGVIQYGPRAWMYGKVTPLESLLSVDSRSVILDQIVRDYPVRELAPGDRIYRMRRNLGQPSTHCEYDSPPEHLSGGGRLDSVDFPVLYASQDIQACIHECRITVDDDVFMGTLEPTRTLRLLDLTHVLHEQETEFESLDMAIHLLFLARENSYEACRSIARKIRDEGFDGVIYPSYFSLIRTGTRPFETVLGLSVRRFPEYHKAAAQSCIRNVALFGYPIADGNLKVACVNRVILKQASYDLTFGPVGFNPGLSAGERRRSHFLGEEAVKP